MNVVSIAAFVALWTETIVALAQLPPVVPTSFSFGGTPQAFGSKYVLLFLPAVASFAFAIISIGSRRPIVISGMRFDPERYAEAQETGRFFMDLVRLILCLGFAFIQLAIIESAHAGRLNAAFGVVIAAFSIALLGTIGTMIVRLAAYGER